MNREENIEKQAQLDECCYVDNNYYAFKRGVDWADENLKEGLVSIDKVCKWIEDIDFEMTYIDGEGFFNKEEFIKNFCKAMEE